MNHEEKRERRFGYEKKGMEMRFGGVGRCGLPVGGESLRGGGKQASDGGLIWLARHFGIHRYGDFGTRGE